MTTMMGAGGRIRLHDRTDPTKKRLAHRFNRAEVLRQQEQRRANQLRFELERAQAEIGFKAWLRRVGAAVKVKLKALRRGAWRR